MYFIFTSAVYWFLFEIEKHNWEERRSQHGSECLYFPTISHWAETEGNHLGLTISGIELGVSPYQIIINNCNCIISSTHFSLDKSSTPLQILFSIQTSFNKMEHDKDFLHLLLYFLLHNSLEMKKCP